MLSAPQAHRQPLEERQSLLHGQMNSGRLISNANYLHKLVVPVSGGA